MLVKHEHFFLFLFKAASATMAQCGLACGMLAAAAWPVAMAHVADADEGFVAAHEFFFYKYDVSDSTVNLLLTHPPMVLPACLIRCKIQLCCGVGTTSLLVAALPQ